jgi:NAD(P)-dependent dehydrogenase (short-subunit alcohol dehydrogenase family)
VSYSVFDLSGKTAVVIGGTGGIGRAVSCGLAEAGANVVATSRRPGHVESAALEIEQRGRRTLCLTSDVGDRSSPERLLSGALDAFGQIQILVNCAARLRRTLTLDVSAAEWNEALDTNLTGTLRARQIFGRHMLDRGYGRIVNIGSISGSVAFHEVAAYDGLCCEKPESDCGRVKRCPFGRPILSSGGITKAQSSSCVCVGTCAYR